MNEIKSIRTGRLVQGFTCVILATYALIALPAEQAHGQDTTKASIEFQSDPVGATFVIGDVPLSEDSDNYVHLDSGEHTVEAFLDGYEPLSYTFTCMAKEELIINYILAPLPPEPQPPESLGLAYIPMRVAIDSGRANRQMVRYRSAAEAFAIFPLGQGVLSRLFLGDDRGSEANIMIASGAVLTVGSIILGKISSNRTRTKIREMNEQIAAENEVATLHNKDVQDALRQSERERVAAWKASSLHRGRVSVVRR